MRMKIAFFFASKVDEINLYTYQYIMYFFDIVIILL